jgi:hypothetical protein
VLDIDFMKIKDKKIVLLLMLHLSIKVNKLNPDSYHSTDISQDCDQYVAHTLVKIILFVKIHFTFFSYNISSGKRLSFTASHDIVLAEYTNASCFFRLF